jgi:cephalosporin-C deacetylase-like acetyl esterase
MEGSMKRSALVRIAISLFAVLAISGAVPAQILAVTPSKPLGVYAPGEKIAWQLELRGEDAAQATQLAYVLRRNGLTVIREGTLPLVDGKATLEATLDGPGTLLAELKVKLPDKEVTGLAGAAVQPTDITPSMPRPADFDEFWAAKLAELASVEAHPVVEAAESGVPGVDYYKIRMDNIRGTHIHGQLAKPTGKDKLPALLIVQWAGVYPLAKDWATRWAEAGWLALNIMPHDLPFDQPEEFYKQGDAAALQDYPEIGNDDRETSYFLRMYLACCRAAEYLAQRPEWDGKMLVVMGGSMGGMQTIVTAALDPRITGAIAEVPAGCDLTGPGAGRASSWPHWYRRIEGKDADKVRQTSRYFDTVNFASRVKCPTLVGLGLVDTTCPAVGVFAMANQLGGPKEVVVMPNAGHNGEHRSFGAREQAWLDALRQDTPPPIHAE